MDHINAVQKAQKQISQQVSSVNPSLKKTNDTQYAQKSSYFANDQNKAIPEIIAQLLNQTKDQQEPVQNGNQQTMQVQAQPQYRPA